MPKLAVPVLADVSERISAIGLKTPDWNKAKDEKHQSNQNLFAPSVARGTKNISSLTLTWPDAEHRWNKDQRQLAPTESRRSQPCHHSARS